MNFLQWSVVFLLLAGPSVFGVSTSFQLTPSVQKDFPLVSVSVRAIDETMVQFSVKVSLLSLSEGVEESERVEAHLQIIDRGKKIVQMSVNNVRPSLPSRIQSLAGVHHLDVLYIFTVEKELVRESRFELMHVQPNAFRHDLYWFYLRDFDTSD